MTPQESTMLNDLVRRVQQTQLSEKDPEAEDFLQQSLSGNPDALYILAQTVLVQNIALDRAQAQMKQLQQQVQDAQNHPQPTHATSFLGSLLGRHDPPPPPQSFPQRAPSPPPQYYPPAPAYPPNYSAAPPPMGAPQGGASSFLRSAATTAAGVAAGALAFQGVESLLHSFGNSGGGFAGGGFGERQAGETVVNNYYDDPNQGLSGMAEHHEREAAYDERPGAGDSPLHNASYEPSADAYTAPEEIDTLDDDTTIGGLDDSSSFDDGGDFDDEGGSDDV